MRGERTFTTYMNIEPGKDNARALSKVEQDTQRSLNRITQLARQAQSATATGGGNVDVAKIQQAAAAERGRAAALQRTVAASNAAAVASARMRGEQIRQTESTRRATRETTRFERSLRVASAAANIAQGPLGPLAGRISAVANAMGALSGVSFGLVGIGAATFAFGRMASQAQDLRSKLAPLYETQAQVNAAFAESQRIAKDARVGLEPVIDLYARLTLAGRDVGLNQQRIQRITEIASKAARLSGGTSVSQEAGLYQFAQGIGSGAIQGDELRSVRENTIRLAKAIADGLGVPISELKKLGAEGKLTAEVIADALEKSADKIDEEIGRLPPTISQASTQMSNAFINLITKADQATGIVGAFARITIFAADNLNGLVQAVGTLALAYAGLRAARLAQDFQKSIAGYTAERAARRADAAELVRTSQQAKAVATAERQNAAERIVYLRQVRAELQQQIIAERAALTERNNALRAASRYVDASNIQGKGPDAYGMKLYTAAVDDARVAADNLNRSKQALTRVQGTLTQQTVVLTGASTRYRAAATALVRAQGAAAAAALSFANAGRALLAAINPLGLALAVGLPLLVQWAFQQDRAAGAADRMADAQSSLSRFIDSTTGKILKQNQALIDNRILQTRETVEESLKSYQSAKNNFSLGGDSLFSVYDPSKLDPNLVRIRDAVKARQLDINTASKQLSALENLSGTNAEFRDNMIRQAGEIAELAGEVSRGNAELRLFQGKGRPGDLNRAFGTFGDPAQISRTADAEDDLAKARDKRAKATDEAAKRERELAEIQRRSDRVADIVGRYSSDPSATTRAARDKRELQQLVNQMVEVRDQFGSAITGENGEPLTRLYTQSMANADKAAIDYGVRQPIRDAIAEQERGLEIQRLRLLGFETEATALEQALQIQDRMGGVREEELEDLVENARRQQEINDLLAQRERQVGLILSVADQTRDSFEEMLVGLRTDPLGSLKSFANGAIDNVVRIQARQLTEQIFEGTDAKLRALLTGSNGVERANEILASHVKTAADSASSLEVANDNLATATERTAERILAAGERLAAGPGGVAGLAAPAERLEPGAVSTAIGAVRSAQQAVKAVETVVGRGGAGGILGVLTAGISIATGGVTGNIQSPQDIIVPGKRRTAPEKGGVPSAGEAYNAVLGGVWNNLGLDKLTSGLDSIFKSGTFFSGIGKSVSKGLGTALGGAGQGMLASGVAGLLGIKQSNIGAGIGGALGSLIPIPGIGIIGGALGGLIGGTIGGLFSSTPRGSARIGGGSTLGISGMQGSSKVWDQSNTLAGSVIMGVQSIADQLGASIDARRGAVSIGISGDSYHVDTTGQGRLKKNQGGHDFNEDQQAAIEFAVRDLISDGVITGISQASQNILRAGGDLQKAIEKAMAIESIGDRLAQRLDPARFAVDQLNEEFTRLISYLKEGSASAQQFADAEKLYELERADAIEQATQRSVEALQAYLDEMKGGSSSPLNKRTVYQNAAGELSGFRNDIAAGKVVDQNELLAAARNFQNASQALYGSGASFFEDFDDLFALLSKARDNMQVPTDEGLPGSPFESDAQVRSMLDRLNSSTNNQTNTLANKLDSIDRGIRALAGATGDRRSAINSLPGFQAAA